MEYKKVKYSDIGKVKSGKRLPKGELVSEVISNNKYIRVRDINENVLNPKDVQYITNEASEKIKNYKVEYSSLEELAQNELKGILNSNSQKNFTIQWEWKYEISDENNKIDVEDSMQIAKYEFEIMAVGKEI